MGKKGLILIMTVLLLLPGCSNMIGKNDLNECITNLEQSLQQLDWETAQKQIDEMKKLYNSNKWKIQFLGDEGEYESLYESINKLNVVLEEKDLIYAKLELATIKSLVNDIYSF